tara:strand:- start:860 stop:1651 length:792 start_codon:yes stop_codon:yes gene_type:complete
MINLKVLLNNSPHKREMEEIIKLSNLALKNWEIYWTSFFSPDICEDILHDLNSLYDLSYLKYGGFDNSERARVACFRKEIGLDKNDLIKDFPGQGIEIKGNFLFDNANQTDFRDLLIEIGLSKDLIGDIWTLGDRGAQGVISKANEILFSKETFFLRDVEVKIKIAELRELKTPINRIAKEINTVEASTRIDAIASFGFRLSRSKINERIRTGLLSLNGSKILKSTINLKSGDKLRLENKGILEILEIEKTKRDRWKIKLIKK